MEVNFLVDFLELIKHIYKNVKKILILSLRFQERLTKSHKKNINVGDILFFSNIN